MKFKGRRKSMMTRDRANKFTSINLENKTAKKKTCLKKVMVSERTTTDLIYVLKL